MVGLVVVDIEATDRCSDETRSMCTPELHTVLQLFVNQRAKLCGLRYSTRTLTPLVSVEKLVARTALRPP